MASSEEKHTIITQDKKSSKTLTLMETSTSDRLTRLGQKRPEYHFHYSSFPFLSKARIKEISVDLTAGGKSTNCGWSWGWRIRAEYSPNVTLTRKPLTSQQEDVLNENLDTMIPWRPQTLDKGSLVRKLAFNRQTLKNQTFSHKMSVILDGQ